MANETPAGSVSGFNLFSNLGIQIVLAGGAECTVGPFEWAVGVEAIGNNEYTLKESFTLVACNESIEEFTLRAFSPSQIATFLTGSEVINGFTPNPVVFGTVRVGELAQRTVTIGSSAGGRIEEIVVSAQRYFAITDPNGCRGRVLAARGTCNINVLLSAPTESGRRVEDTLTVRIAERRFEGRLRAST